MNTIKQILFIFSVFVAIHSNAQTDLEWAGTISGINYKSVHSITTDNNNNIIAVGYFRETVDFALDTSIFELTSNGSKDIFIAKYNSNDSLLWAFNIGANSSDECNSVAVDSLGFIYITGFYNGIVDFDPSANIFTLNNSQNIFIAKYDTYGNFIWAFDYGGFGHIGKSITTDNSGNILVTGKLHGTGDFDPDTNIVNHTSAGIDDIFIAKYDSNMNYLWSYNFGGVSFETIDNEFGHSITTDNQNNVYCIGTFVDTADFNPGLDTNLLISNGNEDVFIIKFDANGNYKYAFSFGANNDDKGYSVKTDNEDNIIVAGIFSGTVDFDPSANIANLTKTASYNSFIAKYDSLGNYLWAILMPNGFQENDKIIDIDTIGNIYCTGNFEGTIDFDPSVDTAIISSNNNSKDIFIAKYNNDGQFNWVYGMGSAFLPTYAIHETGSSIAIDNNSDIIFAGNFNDTVNFSPDTNVFDLISVGSAYYSDIFIAKYSQCQNQNIFQNINICDGDSAFIEGVYQDTAGIYYDIYQTQQGCDSIIITNLTVNPTPNPFAITGQDTVTENQIEIYFVPNDTNLTYVWDINNGTITNQISNDTTEIQWGTLGNGYIYVTTENQYGCISDTAILEISIGTTSINKVINNNEILIYPNPSTGMFIIKGENIQSIEITNINGQTIKQLSTNNSQFSIDLSNQPNGIYFVKIKNDKFVIVKKIILILN